MDTIFRKEIYSPLQIYILCISINSESHTSILARAMLKELSLSLWRPPFSKALISVCYLWENRNAKMEELKIQENENSFFSISEQLIPLQMIDGVYDYQYKTSWFISKSSKHNYIACGTYHVILYITVIL